MTFPVLWTWLLTPIPGPLGLAGAIRKGAQEHLSLLGLTAQQHLVLGAASPWLALKEAPFLAVQCLRDRVPGSGAERLRPVLRPQGGSRPRLLAG